MVVGAFEPQTSGLASAGSLKSTGWTLQHPSGWRVQSLPACPNAPARVGIIVTDTDFVFRNPSGQPPACGDRLVLAGFPKNGVAVALEPTGVGLGMLVSTPDTHLPGPSARLQRYVPE